MDTCIQKEIQTIIEMLRAEGPQGVNQRSDDQLIWLH
jgi:hypothetical protein